MQVNLADPEFRQAIEEWLEHAAAAADAARRLEQAKTDLAKSEEMAKSKLGPIAAAQNSNSQSTRYLHVGSQTIRVWHSYDGGEWKNHFEVLDVEVQPPEPEPPSIVDREEMPF